jgi:roadblock/LC7 domain-containing protein
MRELLHLEVLVFAAVLAVASVALFLGLVPFLAWAISTGAFAVACLAANLARGVFLKRKEARSKPCTIG